MRIVELILDENSVEGIEAISIVENPAIEEDFIALKNQEVQLAEIDKQLLVGVLGVFGLLVRNRAERLCNGLRRWVFDVACACSGSITEAKSAVSHFGPRRKRAERGVDLKRYLIPKH